MAQQSVVFDVSALIGKNIKEVNQILKPVTQEYQQDPEWPLEPVPDIHAGDEMQAFVNDGWLLIANFRQADGVVTSFELGVLSDVEWLRFKQLESHEQQKLFQAGNLQENAITYKVEPQEVLLSNRMPRPYSCVRIEPS